MRTDSRTRARAWSVRTGIGAGGKTGIGVTYPPHAIPNDLVPFEGICDWSVPDSYKTKPGIAAQLPNRGKSIIFCHTLSNRKSSGGWQEGVLSRILAKPAAPSMAALNRYRSSVLILRECCKYSIANAPWLFTAHPVPTIAPPTVLPNSIAHGLCEEPDFRGYPGRFGSLLEVGSTQYRTDKWIY